MKLIHALVLSSMFSVSLALSMSDFVPGFLTGKSNKESAVIDTQLPVRPLVEVKRNASGSDTWYCNRMQNTVSNIFCEKNRSSQVVKQITYDGSKIADQSRMVDNSTTANYAQPSANQSALQTQETKNLIQKYQDNFTVPVPTGKDVKMNINQQQIEFNIKY
jgi:hypothetical protein